MSKMLQRRLPESWASETHDGLEFGGPTFSYEQLLRRSPIAASHLSWFQSRLPLQRLRAWKYYLVLP
jgi:hypothetical protein